MEMFENLAAQADEWFAGAIAWTEEVDVDLAIDASGRRGHDKDAIAHVNCLVYVMRDEKHGGAAIFPQAQYFVLHAHASERVERAEWFIEQKHFGMIDERAGEGDALRHATGKVMRI